jgi:hypothetical protein
MALVEPEHKDVVTLALTHTSIANYQHVKGLNVAEGACTLYWDGVAKPSETEFLPYPGSTNQTCMVISINSSQPAWPFQVEVVAYYEYTGPIVGKTKTHSEPQYTAKVLTAIQQTNLDMGPATSQKNPESTPKHRWLTFGKNLAAAAAEVVQQFVPGASPLVAAFKTIIGK